MSSFLTGVARNCAGSVPSSSRNNVQNAHRALSSHFHRAATTATTAGNESTTANNTPTDVLGRSSTHLKHRSTSRTSTLGATQKRYYSQPATAPSAPKSIFSPDASAWDHVFNGIEDMPPLIPAHRARSGPPFPSPRDSGGRSSKGNSSHRSAVMTAREVSAFDEMFDMIFSAVKDHHAAEDLAAASAGSSLSSAGVGVSSQNDVDELFGKLRHHSKKMKLTTKEDEILDRKKEEMNLCDTDQQLLEWAMKEVFSESAKFTETGSSASTTAEHLPSLRPSTYSHLIALLMRSFRDKYHDPHLALSIFEHAKSLSIPSYVFGCSTLAYNELLTIRWTNFRDLPGVHDTLEEMIVNGVELDGGTLRVLETLRREVGERGEWAKGESTELGSDEEVTRLLGKIDGLIQKSAVSRKSQQVRSASGSASASGSSSSLMEGSGINKPVKPRLDEWKGLDEDEDDNWEFDLWEKASPSLMTQKRSGSSSNRSTPSWQSNRMRC